MYEYEDEGKTSVRNTETGEGNIKPGTWKWKRYLKWVDDGGVTMAKGDDSAKKKVEEIARIMASADDSAVENITVGVLTFRATPLDRSRIAMALGIPSMPYTEVMLADGSMTQVTREALIGLANSILARDQEIYRMAADTIATIKTNANTKKGNVK